MIEEKLLEQSLALCECGDALERIGIKRKLDKPVMIMGKEIIEITDHYIYYCLGCDQYYKLVKTKEPKEKIWEK